MKKVIFIVADTINKVTYAVGDKINVTDSLYHKLSAEKKVELVSTENKKSK